MSAEHQAAAQEGADGIEQGLDAIDHPDVRRLLIASIMREDRVSAATATQWLDDSIKAIGEMGETLRKIVERQG